MFPCADLVDALDVDSFILKGALILDLLWKARNNKVHGEGFLEVGKLMLDFSKVWREHSAIHKSPGINNVVDHGAVKWEHPNEGVFKINCNATVGLHFSSIAAAPRDWKGNLVFAFSKKVNTIIPLQAEVEAIVWAGHLAISHGFSAVIIETNYRQCVQVVFKVGRSPWQIQSAVMDFLNVMESLFWWRLKWVRRSANRSPHVLARWSLQTLSWGPLNFCISPQNFTSICNEDQLSSLNIIN